MASDGDGHGWRAGTIGTEIDLGHLYQAALRGPDRIAQCQTHAEYHTKQYDSVLCHVCPHNPFH
jgi:hypothetical protein